MGDAARAQIFQRLGHAISAGRIDGLEALFSEDFLLHDPHAPAWSKGREGARKMLGSFRELGDSVVLQPVQMIEAGNHVTVRWALSWSRDGAAQHAAILALYRFDDALIAEDWGVCARAPWP